MQDQIKKSIEIKAPVDKVWRALTDHRQFGEWFRAKIDCPFVVGEVTRGQITLPGYEHLEWLAVIKTMEPQNRFAFAWCPGAQDGIVDILSEPQTLVEFVLEGTSSGTRLTITESGFSTLSQERRDDSLRDNTSGWEQQVQNIAAYVEA